MALLRAHFGFGETDNPLIIIEVDGAVDPTEPVGRGAQIVLVFVFLTYPLLSNFHPLLPPLVFSPSGVYYKGAPQAPPDTQ